MSHPRHTQGNVNATRISMNRRLQLGAGVLAVGAGLAACSGVTAGSSAAPSEVTPDAGTASTITVKASKDPQTEAWKKALFHSRLPAEGCFHVGYPSTTWIDVPCDPAPTDPIVPSHFPAPPADADGHEALLDRTGAGGPHGGNVGNGNDFLLVSPSTIEDAVGDFSVITGATSATSIQPDGSTIPNGYSLQMNSNTFAPNPSLNFNCSPPGCFAWQQVLYSNIASQTGIYFQYWLIGYGNDCPTGFTQQTGQPNCFQNSTPVPGVPLLGITDLSQVAVYENAGQTLDGGAGNDDVIMFAVEGSDPPATAQMWGHQYPSVLGLQSSWDQIEFGIFGDLDGDNVNLGSNTTIVAEIQSYPVYPNVSCGLGGTTGETNNLNPVPTSDPNCCYVSSGGDITFMESNVPGVSCTLCGAEDQPCCGVGTACNSGSDYCASTNYCEPIPLCAGGCPLGYICEGSAPGVCVVNHRCKIPEVYCASKNECIAEGGYCPP
jgi:hypothetical protein